MTYATTETSTQLGQPVELYEFTYNSTVYRYTSADVDVVYGGNTYASQPLNRTGIEATQENARIGLDIGCAPDMPLLTLFLYAPPDEVVPFTLRRMHRGDSEAIVIWVGRVLNVTRNGPECSIHCEPIHTSIKRNGLRRMYQKGCPHVLYSAPCGLIRATWVHADGMSSLSGNTLTLLGLSGYADGYFAGGYMEWVSTTTGELERRAIISHVGNELRVTFQLLKLANEPGGWGENYGNYYGGIGISLYPGCDHTIATCSAKFSNEANYGGFPYIPTKNPFDGSPVY